MTDHVMEINEQHERASEAHKEKDAFVSRVSILVAVLAVVTAATSSLENTETAGAITDSSRAVLAQDKATDQWNFYESKSLKKNLFDVASSAGGAKGRRLRQEIRPRGRRTRAQLRNQAKEFEKKRDEAIESSEKHEHRHHKPGHRCHPAGDRHRHLYRRHHHPQALALGYVAYFGGGRPADRYFGLPLGGSRRADPCRRVVFRCATRHVGVDPRLVILRCMQIEAFERRKRTSSAVRAHS